MSRIKECFTTRFENGKIVNADFSQLEVVGLAIISQDEQLIQDIRSGMDMHTVRAALLFNVPEGAVTKAQRQTAKQLSFQLSYGAGAKSMAETNGIALKLAKKFIEQYYERYKRVKQWQDSVALSVRENRTIQGHTPSGLPRGVGSYIAPNGRKYSFTEYDNRSFDGTLDATFSPTEMKNYPIQGYSADVMAVYRSMLLRQLIGQMQDNILFINSVHDSVMFDCKDGESVAHVVKVLYNTCKELPRRLEHLWKHKIPLEFKIDVETGPSWATLTKIGV